LSPFRSAILVLVMLGGCNALLGNDSWAPSPDTPIPMLGDAGRPEADSFDASRDALSSPHDGSSIVTDAHDSGFDPCLVLPDPGTQTCTIAPGAANCPDFGGCLIAFHSGSIGLCQTCTQGNCSGNLHALCSGPDDCSSLFECYCGQCENYCLIDSGECSESCANVGNDTWGVCLSP
jgi:hypothetical protein